MATRVFDGSKKIFDRGPPGSIDGSSPLRLVTPPRVSS
jgi:hypothetical protein